MIELTKNMLKIHPINPRFQILDMQYNTPSVSCNNFPKSPIIVWLVHVPNTGQSGILLYG